MLKEKNIEYAIVENTELNDKTKIKKIEEVLMSSNIEMKTKDELKKMVCSIENIIKE